MSELITFGCVVRDVITRFQGTVTGIVDYITGSRQVLVTPKSTDTTKYPASEWIDADQLEIIAFNTPVAEHLKQLRPVDPDSMDTSPVGYSGSMDTPPVR